MSRKTTMLKSVGRLYSCILCRDFGWMLLNRPLVHAQKRVQRINLNTGTVLVCRDCLFLVPLDAKPAFQHIATLCLQRREEPKKPRKAWQKYRGQVSGSTSKNSLERITIYILHLKYPCNLQHAPKTQTWRWLWHQEIGLQVFWVSDCCPQCVAVPAVGAVVNSTTSFVGFCGEPRKVTLKYLKKHKEACKQSCWYKIHKESSWNVYKT